MIYPLTVAIIKIYFFLLYEIKVEGVENIPAGKAKILVSNHNSLLDAPILAVTTNRKLSAFAKKSVLNTRIKLWYLKKMGGIMVQTNILNRELITKTREVVGNKSLLIIFPEGKINYDGEVGVFNDGF